MPRSDDNHTPYTKRAMAKVMVEAMEQLGHVHFALAGHDRGGRVSYRLALDHPGRLSKLAVLDIAPTYDYWEKLNRLSALKIYHWAFLAQPYPLPETLISGQWGVFPQREDGEPDQGENAGCDRPARAGALSRAVPRSLPDSRDVRGLSCRRLCGLRDRQGGSSRPARRSRCRCWRCGAMPVWRVLRPRRSIRGRNGPRMWRGRRWTRGISCLRKIRR